MPVVKLSHTTIVLTPCYDSSWPIIMSNIPSSFRPSFVGTKSTKNAIHCYCPPLTYGYFLWCGAGGKNDRHQGTVCLRLCISLDYWTIFSRVNNTLKLLCLFGVRIHSIQVYFGRTSDLCLPLRQAWKASLLDGLHASYRSPQS